MYFGSVKFFKHLIYLFYAVLVLVPIIIAMIFATKYYKIKHNAVDINNKDSISQDSSSNDSQSKLDNICEEIKKNGFSSNELIQSLKKNNMDIMDGIFKEHYSNTTSDLDYINKFPDLYATAPSAYTVTDNTIYLTFDDGPSERTLSILSILDKYNIKATFFIKGDQTDRSKEILKEIVSRGHSIGVHSISHNLPIIYKDVDSYLEDFNNTYNYIYNATGVKPDIFRFAGGSINNANELIYQQIIAEMLRRGFVYYDWNVSGEDATNTATWTTIYNNVLHSLAGKSRGIVLLHDSVNKQTTVTVVEDLIINLQKKGYKFDKLTHDVKPITFGYID